MKKWFRYELFSVEDWVYTCDFGKGFLKNKANKMATIIIAEQIKQIRKWRMTKM